jgi:MYXO-CTERM domain-containing protein
MPRAAATRGRLFLTIVGISLLAAPTAFAHIDLLEPEARAHGTAARNDPEIDVNSNLKSGPCGQVTSGRTDRVATYAAGQSITVRVREENAHVSYLRVSIDLDGEQFPLRTQFPGAPETQEEARAAEDALGGQGLLAVVRESNDTPGFVHEIEVTLPDAACTNCTLQVLQYMYDDPAAPYYFQCADLVITAAADAGALPVTGVGGSAAPEASGTTGTPLEADGAAPPAARTAGGTAGSGSAPPGAAGSGGVRAAGASNGADNDGGCGLSPSGQSPAPPLGGAALLALALGLIRRRRPPTAQSVIAG